VLRGPVGAALAVAGGALAGAAPGGVDEKLGGASPSIVPFSAGRAAAGLVAVGSWSAGGGAELGGASPSIVPFSLFGAGATGGALLVGAGITSVPVPSAGGTEDEAAGGRTLSPGPGSTSVPVPSGAPSNASPQPVQAACWSGFCVPQRPHTFMAGRL
jgi:hypothetical protein